MYGPLSPVEAARIQRLPLINRARVYRLYAADSSRWIDCWVDGGRALLGHHVQGLASRMKNELERGLLAPYPNRWIGRLEKAMLNLFEGYEQVRFYRTAERAVKLTHIERWPTDPLDLREGSKEIHPALWGRPLLPGHPESSCLFPILPLSGLSEVQAVLFRDRSSTIPNSDPLSPMIASAMTRLCASLCRYRVTENNEYADIWEKRGPYLVYHGNEDDYGRLFDAYFDRRVLIAPSARRPSVYPSQLSPGERAHMLLEGENGQ